MKKNSVKGRAVFGALAFCTIGASAQSNVTIYGTIDLGVAKSNGGLSNNPTQGTVTTASIYQVTPGRANRLGFRGNEDLGGGLSAQFQIEHRLSADTGATTNANSFWAGLSYVQLTSTQFGKVYLGRNLTPTYLLSTRLDPFGWDGVAEMGLLQFGNYRTPDPVASTTPTNNGRSVTSGSAREANTVGYISPSFNGVSAHAATSLSESTNLGRVMSINVNYEVGPLLAGISAEKVYHGIFQDQSLYSGGISYNFGVTRVMAFASRSTYGARMTGTGITYFTSQALPASLGGGTMNTIGGANLTHAKTWEIGAVTPIGAGALKTGYIRVNPDGPNNLIQKLGVGYDYFLSKRTKVYLDGAYAKEDTLSKSKLLSLGVRHDF